MRLVFPIKRRQKKIYLKMSQQFLQKKSTKLLVKMKLFCITRVKQFTQNPLECLKKMCSHLQVQAKKKRVQELNVVSVPKVL